MRFLLRADAGIQTGTGHVMRCLALAEELMGREHEVLLRGTLGGVEWLHRQVAMARLPHEEAPSATLDIPRSAEEGWNAVVFDSYTIDPVAISQLNAVTPVLAIIDGDDRGITAWRYLDQNLGAERQSRRPEVGRSLLAGSRYALVRRAVRELRRDAGLPLPLNPSVLAFMGGSDPLGAVRQLAAALRGLPGNVTLTLVTAPAWQREVRALVAGRASTRILEPTADFPELLAHANIVVSATGTSAWDICTMGIPAVFAAVVDNQRAGLRAIVEAGVALGIDASDDLKKLEGVRDLVQLLLSDESLRRQRAEASLQSFDGCGASRVADELEKLG